MTPFRVGGHDVSERVLVVAEIGNNHEGDMEIAKELVRQASLAGADAVKLQTYRPELYVSRLDADRFEQLERFALTFDQHAELADFARSLDLLLIATPFDLDSALFLSPIVDALKIASGDIAFGPLVRRCAASDRPMIISTGISDLDEVDRTVNEICEVRAEREPSLAILHCVSAYPLEPGDANLRAIPVLRERFGLPVGWSDHTLGTDAAVVAVGLGAQIIEKHVTLEGIASDFRDHALSATPAEFADLVRRIRRAAALRGQPKKEIPTAVAASAGALRRSLAAIGDLRAGHVLSEADLTWVRPGGGVPPDEERPLLGHALTRDVRAGEQIRPEDVGV